MTTSVIAPLMATSPRRCLERSRLAISRSRLAISASLYAYREESCTVPFESDSREWTWWRTLQDRAILYREESSVAGTFKPVLLRRKVNGTRQVCALLAVGHVFLFAGTYKDAMIPFGRVSEEFHTANRDFTHLGHRD